MAPNDGDNDFKVNVSWRLGNDPDRPNKRSKKLTIVVPKEVIDDYLNKPKERQVLDDKKLKIFIEQELHKFDPNHDSPNDIPPPEEIWIAGANILDS